MCLAETPAVEDDLVARLPVRMRGGFDNAGEIDAGDTFIYEEGGWEARKQAERVAVARILGLLPDSQAAPLMDLWLEFEAADTPEARFANAVDRAMPALLNLANGGQSWRENGITYDRVIARIAPPIKAGCPALWEYMQARLAEADRDGWFGTRAPMQEQGPEKS